MSDWEGSRQQRNQKKYDATRAKKPRLSGYLEFHHDALLTETMSLYAKSLGQEETTKKDTIVAAIEVLFTQLGGDVQEFYATFEANANVGK
ncbi:hypothetical protein [Vibrio sp. Hal054]|uniref:hypothetical protein n=1 Tax=Vibrio sp. Hal054 TaxID=3035158 RepID=UPI00301C5EDB